MMRVSQIHAFLIASITLSMFTIPPAIAEEGTVEAFSSWQARGQIYPTGTAEATFVGALFGILYVKNKDGSFDTGRVTCPAVITINTSDTSQSSQGRCVILTPDVERIYAEFKCSGTVGSGCNGNLTFKGGTGAKENITGGGPIQFKAAFADMMAVPGNIVDAAYAGIAVLPKLTYKLP
jgi:hypothetical protein